jgi:Xaa-Pro aminopeptidase
MPHSTIRTSLEQAIAAAKLDFYLVPMVDEFQGEYIPAYAARLPYVTGFTGSAGLGVFCAKSTAEQRHALFVDGRYTLQAAKEVDGAAVDVINSGDMPFLDLVAKQGEGLSIGFDAWLITQAQLEGWKKATALQGVRWVSHTPNLVDSIWAEQPAPPAGEVMLHPMEYAGRSYADKRAAMLDVLAKHRADAVLLTQADSINWLLNIRGGDVPFNPLLLAHMILRADGAATLFMHPHALSEAVAAYFAEHQVTVAPLADVFAGNVTREQLGARVLMDASATAVGWFVLAEKLGTEVVRSEDPAQHPKALKNVAELAGIRAAHARDGLSLSRFLHWFDTQVSNSHFPEELKVVERLEHFRAEDASYRGGSFATIAGSGPHGAIVHYRADEKSNRKPRVGELFLLDSGGQYPDGTTDVTRTIYVSGPSGGTPAPKMKEHFTRVLKGHIALAMAKFPAGTTGAQLDVLARQYLWEVGLDFDHGTGHGVGAYLCVHEGPQRISKRGGAVALEPGMILSNEPGYYEAGHYGIRIENLVAVVAMPAPEGQRPMRGFETLTLAPIDTRLVEVTMLSANERNWLNAYHQRVFKAHADKLDEKAREWLNRATRAV